MAKKKLAYFITAEDKKALASLRNLTAGFQGLLRPLDKVNGRLRANYLALAPLFDRLGRWQRQLNRTGKDLSFKVSLPMAAGFGIGLRQASEFEKIMLRVKAISQASQSDMAKMSEMAKRLGAETQYSMAEVGEAFATLTDAGYTTKEKLSIVPGLLDLAVIAKRELSETAEFATNIMDSFGKKAADFKEISDKLAYAITHTKTNFYFFHEALMKVASTGKSVGVHFDEVAAIMMTLAKMGHKGPEAGTAVASGLMNIIDLTPDAELALAGLGIPKSEVVYTEGEHRGKVKSLISFFDLLKKKRATTDIYVRIFGKDPAKYLLSLKDEIERMRDFERQILTQSQGTAEKTSKAMLTGFSAAFERLKSSLDGLNQAFFESGPLDWATELTDKLANFVDTLASLSPTTFRVIAAFAAFIAVLGPLFLALKGVTVLLALFTKGSVIAALSGVIAAFSLFAVKVLAVMAALGALTYGGVKLVENWDKIKEFADKVRSRFEGFFSKSWLADDKKPLAYKPATQLLDDILKIQVKPNRQSFSNFVEKPGAKDRQEKSVIDLNVRFDNLPEGAQVSAKKKGEARLNFNTGLLMGGSF